MEVFEFILIVVILFILLCSWWQGKVEKIHTKKCLICDKEFYNKNINNKICNMCLKNLIEES